MAPRKVSVRAPNNRPCNRVCITIASGVVKGPLYTCADENGCPQPFICPLSRVIAGTAVRVKKVGASREVSRRLRELGLREEQQIKLLSRRPNLICLVCNARLAISSQVAESILVEPLPSRSKAG